jgi:hypothetical protein
MSKKDKKKKDKKKKKKDKEKTRHQSDAKSSLNPEAKRAQKLKKGKPKVLWQEIARLTQALKARDDEILALKSRQEGENTSAEKVEDLAVALSAWQETASVSDRKKVWERHQYLRTRYEHHLEAGLNKNRARICADQDLRGRYGEDAGYTEEQLEAILS